MIKITNFFTFNRKKPNVLSAPSIYWKKIESLLLLIILTLQSCTYIKTFQAQKIAELSYSYSPSQNTKKKLITERKLTVYGQINSTDTTTSSIIIAAFSNKYGTLEVVDSKDLERPGYYTLNLPQGQYQIFVFADINSDSIYNNDECVGYYKGNEPFLNLNSTDSSKTIFAAVDIQIDSDNPSSLDLPFKRAVLYRKETIPSTYYPSGAIRSLDDKLFSPEMGTLGLYDPPAFLSQTDMYFYALRERDFNKIPIVFIHGIGGTPLEWKNIVEGIDSTRFDPWFFYYPSGEKLDKVTDIFYEIFLSGRVINMRERKLILIAHSMGGLVARAAINKYTQNNSDDFLKMYISLCTPYGGNKFAMEALKKAPLIINSWRDVAIQSDFIKSLEETPLPDWLSFHLLFAYRNDNTMKIGPNNDGSITLESQLAPYAQFSAKSIHGYNETHTSILGSKDVIGELNKLLSDF